MDCIGDTILGMKVFAFGFGAEATWEIEDITFSTMPVRDSSIDLTPADISIVHARQVLGPNAIQAQAAQLLFNRVLTTAGQGRSIALVYGAGEDIADRTFAIGHLLGHWGLQMGWDVESLKHVFSVEFVPYLSEYGFNGTSSTVPQTGTEFICAIAGSADDKLSALAVRIGRGLVYIVPGNVVGGAEHELVNSLTSAILAHSRSLARPRSAPIVESFSFTNEAPLHVERAKWLEQIEQINSRLAEYNAIKDILFLRDDPLADRLPGWIEHHLGIRTQRHESYVEDFWLVDERGAQLAICEAKGLSDNVKREHVTQLVHHREERDLPDDFPSMLVANTFAAAETERAKDKQRIGPNECRKAVRNNVLILRTLDLVRLSDQLERGIVTTADILGLITNEIGWLKVTGDTRTVVK